MRRFAGEMGEHRMELVRLDTAIGDGDHGTNMDRGMKKAVEKLDGTEAVDIRTDLKAGVKGGQARGKAESGDKTMIDAWLPAIEALRQGGEIGEALTRSADAAE